MMSFINKIIKKSRKMTVISGIYPFIKGSIITINKMKKISDNGDIYRIKIDSINYIIKYIDDTIEWNTIKYILEKKDICPQLITYYACLKYGKTKYILMECATSDLEEYYDINPLNNFDIYKITDVCFNFLQWSIKHLELVHIDLKLDNLMYCNDGSIKIIDLELMESVNDTYMPERKLLAKKSIDNQMYPRRKCTYSQFGLFSVVIIILESLSVCENLLVGRKTDDKLCEIIDGLIFFNNEPELADLFKNIINLKYTDIQTPIDIFNNIKINKFYLD